LFNPHYIASTALVFSASSCVTGSTGWQQWSYNIPGQGAYRIIAQVVNGGDNAFDSDLQVDAFTYEALHKVGP
jgi:hypothetical protein